MRMRLLHVSGYPCVFCIRAGRICGCDFDDRDKGEPGVGRDDNRNVMLHGQPSLTSELLTGVDGGHNDGHVLTGDVRRILRQRDGPVRQPREQSDHIP